VNIPIPIQFERTMKTKVVNHSKIMTLCAGGHGSASVTTSHDWPVIELSVSSASMEL
jgi:hypothetical protein